jgi:hypothetical protein
MAYGGTLETKSLVSFSSPCWLSCKGRMARQFSPAGEVALVKPLNFVVICFAQRLNTR